MSTQWQAGDRVGEFELVSPLGRGGFGAVWRARRGDHLVALKLLHLFNDEALRRFDLEAQTLELLQHPNTVRIVGHGVAQDTHFIAMELVEGETLSTWMKARRTYTEKCCVLEVLANCLAHAHAHGVLHRDLKPANVIVPEDPSDARVVDFGIAKLIGVRQMDVTKTGEVLGTPGFMSPEQLRGHGVVPASDVYALGAIAFELFTGHPPFVADSAIELAMQHLMTPVPQLPGVEPRVASFVRAMLDKDPASRPSLHACARLFSAGHGGATLVPKPPMRAPAAKSRSVIGVVAVAVCLVALVAGVASWSGEEPRPTPVRTRTSVAALLAGAEAPDQGLARSSSTDVAGDVGFALDASPESGCDLEPLRPGFHFVEDEYLVRIPAGHDNAVPQPLVIAFHDFWMTPQKVIETPAIIEEADARGWVVFAPRNPLANNTWEHEYQYEHVAEVVELLESVVCFDADRIVLLGLGRGGHAVRSVARRVPGTRAVATTSYRRWGDKVPAAQAEVPRLFISALDDELTPADGGQDCFANTNSWPIEQHESKLRDLHGCVGREETVFKDAGGTCKRPAKCDVELELCRAEGGRHWPGLKLITTDVSEAFQQIMSCEPGETKFPAGKYVFEFFDRHVSD